MTSERRFLAAAGLAVAAAAVAIRVQNAFTYPVGSGFDAEGNWQYIRMLLDSWRLPAPEEGWSTSHPPLFYYAAAALVRLAGVATADAAVPLVRLGSAAMGLGVAGITAWLALRLDPERPVRALVAGALVLYLPVAIQLSAMLSEEIWGALFVTAALAGTVRLVTRTGAGPPPWLGCVLVGLAGGCAALTKLSGWLVVAAAGGALLIEGWRRRRARAWTLRAAAIVATALVVGGWYYAWNWVERGYLYPHALGVHTLMLRMPPGERTLVDYLRVPLETWTGPDLLSPALVRSVWGSTYATIFFDGHRHFLPRSAPRLEPVATALLLLGLVPTLAFVDGLRRGLGRWVRRPGTADGPLVLLTGLTLAGYVAFTWQNPWFASVKGSYLLGLSLPFGLYASESLEAVARRGSGARLAVVALLATWVLLAGLVFTQGVLFEKSDPPGLSWTPVGRS